MIEQSRHLITSLMNLFDQSAGFFLCELVGMLVDRHHTVFYIADRHHQLIRHVIEEIGLHTVVCLSCFISSLQHRSALVEDVGGMLQLAHSRCQRLLHLLEVLLQTADLILPTAIGDELIIKTLGYTMCRLLQLP